MSVTLPVWMLIVGLVLAFGLGVFTSWAVFGSYGGGQSSG